MKALLEVDRRWIFLLVFVAILIPTIFPFEMPIKTSGAVEGIYAGIDKLPPRAPVMVAIDFDPASQAEVAPMVRAALRQVFRKDLRLITLTHWVTGVNMARQLVDEAAAEFDDVEVEVVDAFPKREAAKARVDELNAAQAPAEGAAAPTGTAAAPGPRFRVNCGRRTVAPLGGASGGEGAFSYRPELIPALAGAKPGAYVVAPPARGGREWQALRVASRAPTLAYGKDYCFLGTKAGEHILVIIMGESISAAFPTDSRGNSTRDLPVLEGVRSLKDVSYLLDVTSGAQAEWWLIYGAQRHRIPMGAGCTAVVAPDLYPYYGAGQLTGLAGGIKGAWEYEALVGTPLVATKAVPAQTIAHAVLILLIFICNLAYFLGGRKPT